MSANSGKCFLRVRPAPWTAVLTTAALLLGAGGQVAQAEVTPVYSFEFDAEGFGPNGLGIDVTQDTVGATQGMGSLKLDLTQDATFVGALTQQLPPEIGDPPGMDFVIFDLTIPEAFPESGFVSAGITVFGHSQPDHPNGQQFGLQAQFLDNEFPLGDLAPGTHEVRMDLTSALHPLTFTFGSFNDIFGMPGTDVNDVIPSGFQIYIHKSTHAPWVGYIDDVRVGRIDADFNDDDQVDGADLALWESNFGPGDVDADADDDGDSDGADFLAWQRQVGSVAAPAVSATAVPEPGMMCVAMPIIAAASASRRRRAGDSMSATLGSSGRRPARLVAAPVAR
jgi:hypothetical protein